MKLALFDLDHTLLPIDSDQSWGEFTVRLGWHDRDTFLMRNDEFYAHYQAGTLDIHDYVRFAAEAFCQRGPDVAAQAHAQFMREVVQPAIHQQALALVQKHREAGDRIVIVTATNEFVTRPIAQAFGVEDLIAVELVRDPHGWFTNEILGVPSLRDGKVQRLQQWLLTQGLDWADVDATFYSDSRNDLPLLERVNHPVATNPDDTLRAVALEKGWPILELFPKQ
jgi:HAD superfamily hydrolase (TIGR01490 family)